MANSFNELFGLGSHSPDANLEGWWPMLDNAASTTVVDYSGNSLNGTLNGGDNTSAKADTGPNNWQSSALHLNGTDDYISAGLSALGSDSLTFLAHTKIDVEPPGAAAQSGFGKLGEAIAVVNSASHYPFTDSNVYNSVWRGTSSTAVSRVSVGNPSPALTSWRQLCIKTTPGASGWKFRLDQSNIATATGITGVYTGGANWHFGRSEANAGATYYYDGLLAFVSIFSRHLSDTDEAQAFAGPEPIVVSGSDAISGTQTEGQTLSASGATWGLDTPYGSGTNGTITYAYQWTRSDNGSGLNEADIGSATSSTYTLQAADVGKYIRRRVRATNDGGTDTSADHNSSFSGAIAAASSLTARNFGGKFQRASNRHLGGIFQRAV